MTKVCNKALNTDSQPSVRKILENLASLNYADYLGVTLVKVFEVLMCYMIHINLSLSNHEEKPAIFLHLGDK